MTGKFDERSARRIAGTVKRVEGMPVDQRRPTVEPRGTGEGGEVYRIATSTRDGTNFRWTYTGYRQAWTGGFTWVDVGGPVPMLNLIEADNTASTTGVQSGIDLAVQGITGIKAVPNTRVRGHVEYRDTGEGVIVFEYLNPPDGIDCTEA